MGQSSLVFAQRLFDVLLTREDYVEHSFKSGELPNRLESICLSSFGFKLPTELVWYTTLTSLMLATFSVKENYPETSSSRQSPDFLFERS